ncbi:MAG: DUF342 domain-containing protein [Lachnospiraceae bacterium]|nr:DUF342 domain-containing protein [Lachnospiraceae bacterium]
MSDILKGKTITDDELGEDITQLLDNIGDYDEEDYADYVPEDERRGNPEDDKDYVPAINRISVRTSKNLMEAYIVMPKQAVDRRYWILESKEVIDYLTDMGVVFGVDPMAVRKICDSPVFGMDVLVAKGDPPIEGTQGHFEFFFETKLSNKPVIKEDGTVDFKAIKAVETVKKDAHLVHYHPAEQGSPGTNVCGFDVAPKPIKDLPPLTGKGFYTSDDGLDYYADMAGKIEYKDKRITLSPVFEVNFDVGTDIGNVDFEGDVIIHGCVTNEAYIKAAGSITVDQVVDNCSLYSKKDIILKSGVKGNENTTIKARGSITTEFVEFADVSCEGDLYADVLFNSNVDCDARIHMVGNHSSIIGGHVNAVEGIEAKVAGNEFGVRSFILFGMSPQKIQRMKDLKEEIKQLKDEVAKVEDGLLKFERMSEERGLNFKEDPRRIQLLRAKVRHEVTIGEREMEYKRLEELKEKAKDATLKVNAKIYGGVDVLNEDHEYKVIDYEAHVEFRKGPTGIRMEKIV